jgi:hypothetical protein
MDWCNRYATSIDLDLYAQKIVQKPGTGFGKNVTWYLVQPKTKL